MARCLVALAAHPSRAAEIVAELADRRDATAPPAVLPAAGDGA